MSYLHFSCPPTRLLPIPVIIPPLAFASLHLIFAHLCSTRMTSHTPRSLSPAPCLPPCHCQSPGSMVEQHDDIPRRLDKCRALEVFVLADDGTLLGRWAKRTARRLFRWDSRCRNSVRQLQTGIMLDSLYLANEETTGARSIVDVHNLLTRETINYPNKTLT